MVDTFRPLRITKQAAGLEDERYPYSWLPTDDAPGEAEALAERGPGGVPRLSSPFRAARPPGNVRRGRPGMCPAAAGRRWLSPPRVALRSWPRRDPRGRGARSA